MEKIFSSVVKIVRTHLKMSQEDLARELGVSFATVNRWENSKTQPSRLARKQFDFFCESMRKEGRLK
ncbi:MAG: transcriptional regulator [Fibrobacteres bacterium CG2_30_45_31]|nr:MAG: transcriptional regulator [Fibrobacteres bacterium CG2_30_45_31]